MSVRTLRQEVFDVRLYNLYKAACLAATVEVCFACCAEFDDARDEREKCVVFACADVLTGKNFGATLTNDDFTSRYRGAI